MGADLVGTFVMGSLKLKTKETQNNKETQGHIRRCCIRWL